MHSYFKYVQFSVCSLPLYCVTGTEEEEGWKEAYSVAKFLCIYYPGATSLRCQGNGTGG